MSIVDAGTQEIGGSLEKLLVLLTNPEEYAKRSAELLTQENTVRASIRQQTQPCSQQTAIPRPPHHTGSRALRRP